MTTYLTVLVLSFAISLILTPIVRILALELGFLDHPDGDRKLHTRGTPLGGGVAVFGSMALAIGVVYVVPGSLHEVLKQQRWALVALFVSCALIVAIGLADDRLGLKGRHKLLGQILAASILVASGLLVSRIQIFHGEIALGLLAIPFTLFWLVGAINSINLLDGIDGLASCVGILLSATVSVVSLLNGHETTAAAGAVCTGSLLAFTCFKSAPANIFLGDAGSMLIGLFIGAVTIRASSEEPGTMAIAVPLAIWAIPVFDTAVAITRRTLSGRSLYTPDRGHLHHCLLTLFGSHRRVVGVIALCCATTCGGAMLSVYLRSDAPALFSVVLVVGALVATRSFGYAELLRSARWLKAAGLELAATVFRRPGRTKHVTQGLDVTRRLDLIKEHLTEHGESLGDATSAMATLRIDSKANIPLETKRQSESLRDPTRL